MTDGPQPDRILKCLYIEDGGEEDLSFPKVFVSRVSLSFHTIVS